MPACGAKTRAGTPCQKAGMANGRCRNHGGASLVGPAHPSYRTGRHSKYLKGAFGAKYLEGINDPRLIGLRDEVALVDARIAELLDALSETGNTRFWKEARARFDAFRTSVSKGKESVGDARLQLEALDRVLAEGLTAAATWDTVGDLLELRRKLVDSETKRQKDLFEMVTTEHAMHLMGQLIAVVTTHVKDADLRAALSHEFRRLVGRGDRATPDA